MKLYFLFADTVEYIVGLGIMNKLLISMTCQIEFKRNKTERHTTTQAIYFNQHLNDKRTTNIILK